MHMVQLCFVCLLQQADAKKCLDQWYELVQDNAQTVPMINAAPVSCHLDYNCIFLHVWFWGFFNLLEG